MSNKKTYRKYAATTMAAAAAVASVAPVATAADTSKEFSDVNEKNNGSHIEAIYSLVERGVITGYDDNTFRPANDVSRLQVAKMIQRALELDVPENAEEVLAGYSDLDGRGIDQEGLDAIAAVTAAGYLTGSNGQFDPTKATPREQMATILVRAYDLEQYNTDEVEDKELNFDKVSASHRDNVQTLVNLGISTEAPDFRAWETVTREQFATFLYRAINFVEEAPVEEVDPVVESVSAINAKQIQVIFNQEVDVDSAEDLGNYFTQNATTAKTDVATSDSTARVDVSDDGKTVTITATTNVEDLAAVTEEGTPFTFEVDGVETKNGEEFPKFSTELKVEDTVAPELISADAKASANTKTVTLLFSEPVDPATGVYKVNGKVASVAPGSTPNTLTLTSVDSLQAGKSYSVEVLNAHDFAGNILESATTTVNVVEDSNSATITSVSTVSDNVVRVTFDKSMDRATLTNGNVIVINSNGQTITTGNYGVTRVENTSNKTFDITFTGGLYAGVDSEALTLVFNNNIKDTSGNAISTVTKTATLKKDVVAPTVKSAQVLPAGEKYDGVTYTDGAFVFTFDEDVVAPGSITAGSIKVVDQDGTDISADVTYGTPVLNSKNANILVVPFATNTIPTTSKTATVRVPAGVTQDDTLGSNDNKAATFNNIDLKTPLADTVKPVVNNVVGAANNTITFDITEANLDKSTVQDVNNYRLDGKPLADGSYVTIGTAVANVHPVTVHLAEGSVAKTQDYAFTITGIKDLSGNVANTVAVNNVSLLDDVKPVLESSKINADNTFTLTFSEAVTGVLETDLEIYANGLTTAIDDGEYTVTAITSGADAGAVLVELQFVFEDTDTNPSNGDEKLFIDVDGDGVYNSAVDILLLEGTFADATAAETAYGSSVVDLSDLTSIKVKTASPTAGIDGAGNTIKSGTLITIK